jgi:stage V sporulation protein B
MFQTSTIIVGALLGASAAAVYSVPTNLVLQFVGVIVGIAAVVMPVSTEMSAQGRMRELQSMVFKWTKVAVALTAAGAVLALVFGPDLLVLFFGQPFRGAAGVVLQVLMISMILFAPIRGTGVPMLMGIGHAAQPTFAMLIAGTLSCLMCLAFVRPYGPQGAAIANGLAIGGLSIALLVMTCRALKLTLEEYIRNIAMSSLPAILGLLLLGYCARSLLAPYGSAGLLAAAAFTAVAIALAWIFVVLRNDEHVLLADWLPFRKIQR